MGEPATKEDLQLAIAGLRVEWRDQMLTQVRWFAGIVIVQTFALAAIMVAILKLVP
jgi:hypothetical protein